MGYLCSMGCNIKQVSTHIQERDNYMGCPVRENAVKIEHSGTVEAAKERPIQMIISLVGKGRLVRFQFLDRQRRKVAGGRFLVQGQQTWSTGLRMTYPPRARAYCCFFVE